MFDAIQIRLFCSKCGKPLSLENKKDHPGEFTIEPCRHCFAGFANLVENARSIIEVAESINIHQ